MVHNPYRPAEPVEIELDHEPALWIEQACLGKRFAHVEAVLPTVFEAYARVLHPIAEHDGGRLLWADVAAANGRRAHRLMQFPSVALPAGSAPADDPYSVLFRGLAPEEGSLAQGQRDALIDVLRAFTATPDHCYFGVWEGFGDERPYILGQAPRLHIPERAFYVYRGPIEGARAFPDGQSPNMWWPADRVWCVATEVDLSSTYVGGSAACIDALLAEARLESYPAEPGDPVHYAADTINT